MRFVFYTHSLVSDWNHGNAHFLRGIMHELGVLGHETVALEPEDGWSRANLVAAQGEAAVERFRHDFPYLHSRTYGTQFAHEDALADADVVVVHEWTDPKLVARIGRMRRAGARFMLIFHDTHHRAVSAGAEIAALDLEDYDLILAFGETLRERYLEAGWGRRVVTWHEAADTMLFRPLPEIEREGDLVWIGNWGDGERSQEIGRFLIGPVRRLGIGARVNGVRYPAEALAALRSAGIDYGGWIANADVPAAFARHRVTIHIPRRPYVETLPGIPTIRVFEALACSIPLVSAPWEDAEGLFRPGKDFLIARDGSQMEAHLRMLLNEPGTAAAIAASGMETVRERHTCRHRVQELFSHLKTLGWHPQQHETITKEAAE